MGAFFTNIHLRGASAEDVTKALKDIGATPAYLVQSSDRWTSAFPKCTEEQDMSVLTDITKLLSEKLQTWGLCCLVHDSDIFNYVLFKSGIDVDVYDSAPGYWSGEDVPPSGGNFSLLAQLLEDDHKIEDVEHILQSADTQDEFLFADDRWRRLAVCLGIDEDVASSGFEYLSTTDSDQRYALID